MGSWDLELGQKRAKQERRVEGIRTKRGDVVKCDFSPKNIPLPDRAKTKADANRAQSNRQGGIKRTSRKAVVEWFKGK